MFGEQESKIIKALNSLCSCMKDSMPAPVDYSSILNTIAQNTLNTATNTGNTNTILNTTNSNLASVVTLLTQIDVNTENLEARLNSIIAAITTSNGNLTAIITELQSILVQVTAINANTDNIETLLNSVISNLNLILNQADLELIFTPESKVNNGSVNFLYRQRITYDSEAGIIVSTIPEFSVDGMNWSTTPISGPYSLGHKVILNTEGVSIAEGIFASTLGPDGTNWTSSGILKSVTILARRSSANNAINDDSVNPNRVLVTNNNKFVLLRGESITYSSEDFNSQIPIKVDCFGNSAALIIFKYI